MKHIILWWWLLGVSGMAWSQTVTIRDQETREPLELVSLRSDSPGAFATTNTRGQADLTAFKGSEKIEIRLLGYASQLKSYTELEQAAFELQLTPASLSLTEAVVSGTRWQQASSQVPSRITTVTPKEVALQNPQTAADLLALTGKVFIQKSQQGGGSPMIRGFATNRLLYTVDGVRMNTAIFRAGNIQNVINLDPFATERIEVLFGPGSVIYGSDAIGGVMAFQTLTPQLSLNDTTLVTGKAVTRYSSANNERTGHFDLNVGWKKWALVASFSSWDFGHLRQGSRGPEDYLKPYYVERQDSVDVVITQGDPLKQIPSAYSQVNLMQKLRFRPSEKWDFQYGFHYSETSPYGRYDRHNRVRNGTARYAEWNYGPQTWQMHHLQLAHIATSFAFDQVTLRLAQQTFGESRIDRTLNRSNRLTNEEKVQAYSANLDLSKATGTRNTLYYGAEYVFNDVTSTGRVTDITTDSTVTGPARYPDATWSSVAAYVNDAFRVSERFTLQAGLRYNQYALEADFRNNLPFYPFPYTTASLSNGALTGSLGGVYRPTDNWVISANYGTAFRSPNVDDLGKVFDSEPGTVTVPNPNLQAEYAHNVDLGVARVFGQVLKLDVTGYYTSLQNALVRRNFQLNGQDSILYDGDMSRVQAIQNAAKATVYGVQAGLELQLPAGFKLLSDLSYQKGEEELDDGTTSASRHAAPLFGITRLQYTARDLVLQCYATYQSERKFEDLAQEEQSKDEIYAKDAAGKNYAPAWYTLNLKALYALNRTFSVSAGLENITDQRYRPFSSGISAPGRNFILSLRASF